MKEEIEKLLTKIVAKNSLHVLWLNTLSLMENPGARKIKNCEHPIFVNEIILKHAAEEARHAYYLKKQISKIDKNACPSYERKYLLAPTNSFYYLQELDISVCRFLKEKFHYTNEKLKYVAYLLVTFAIEVRADKLYPIYQNVLDNALSKVNVKSIIAEEENHLKEMKTQIAAFTNEAQMMCSTVLEMEQNLFQNWLLNLQKEIE